MHSKLRMGERVTVKTVQAKTGSAPEASLGQVEALTAQAWAQRFVDPSSTAELAQEAYRLAAELNYEAGAVEALFVLTFSAFYASAFGAQLAYAREAWTRAQGQLEALQARAWHLLGAALLDAEAFPEAEATLQEAKTRFEGLADAAKVAEVSLEFAYLHICRGEFTEALGLLQRAQPALTAPHLRAQLSHSLAVVTSHLGDNEASQRHCEKTLELAKKSGDRRLQVLALTVQGNSLEARGELALALNAYLEALARKVDTGVSDGKVETLENVANVYDRLGETERALHYALEALGLARELKHSRLEAEARALLGRFYRRQGDVAQARVQQLEAQKLSAAHGDRKVLAQVSLELGLLTEAAEPETALAYFRSCEHEARALGYTVLEVEAQLGVARVLTLTGRPEEVYGLLKDGLDRSQTCGFKLLEAQFHQALAEHFQQTQNFRAALASFKTFYALDKRLSQQQMGEKARTLMLQFDLEQVEKSAGLERRKNAELDALNRALQATNEENAQLVAQLRKQAVRLEQQTREDALTGLYNRRHLEAQLALEFRSAERYGSPLCVALVDIDDFKRVNDTMSHQVGDEVLRIVAEIFRQFVRDTDIVARYGGEEFALVFLQTPLPGSLSVCERIRESVATHPWEAVHAGLRVTLSVGVAADLSVKDHEKLLAQADAKLYEAKRRGKNCVVA